jgi:AcrR family transcriptional regulator
MMKASNPQEALYAEIFGFQPSLAQKRTIQIIEGAIKSYASVGIENTTYDRIAKICKISRPLVQHYLEDKESLFEMVAKYIRSHFQQIAIQAIKAETDPLKQLTAYIHSTFFWIKKFPDHACVWQLIFYYCHLNPKLRELNTQLVDMGTERIASLLTMGQSQKVFACKDARATAQLIQIIITGSLLKATTENMKSELDVFANETVEICLGLARG